MVGKDRLNDLDKLIEQVARGQRRLDSITDPRLREAIRVALRIHQNAPAAPDDYARLRMRARVLSRLDPRGPNLADNAWIALEVFGRPAPIIVRGVALAALLVVAGMSASVAAADTIPDDILYPVKVASETVRLALAAVPDDRAGVELSIAEHRLAEAEKLAASGRTSDALVASAMYTQHVASAAAELVPNDSSAVARQLEATFAQQRDRAQQLSTTLSSNTKSAAAAQILATIAKPTVAPGVTVAERVAVTAAGVAQQLAAVAEHDAAAATTPTAPHASAATVAVTATPAASSRTNDPRPQQAAASVSTTAPQNTTASRDTAHATAGPRATSQAEKKASDVLKVVRKAADDAKASADKTKNHK